MSATTPAATPATVWVRVECRAEGRAEERPRALIVAGRRFEVVELTPTGYHEDARRRRWRTFAVRLDDGRRGELRHDDTAKIWAFT